MVSSYGSSVDADRKGIAQAVAALEQGLLIGLPTETVYGLACDAARGEAVAALYAAKGRPSFNPLIAHVPDLVMAQRVGQFNTTALRLARAFWPAPLTLVVPITPDCPVCALARAGLDSIALRIPAHPVALDILRQFGKPVVAPSANRSGHISATTAAHVAEDLGDKIALIVDAGACSLGVESTIISCMDETPRLLRPGALTRQDIEAALGFPLLAALPHAPHQPQAAGMLKSHYAPRAKVRLNATDIAPHEALITFGSALPRGHEQAQSVHFLSSTGNLQEAAAHLFELLRAVDALNPHTIAITPIEGDGLGEAIRDRLQRAAADRS